MYGYNTILLISLSRDGKEEFDKTNSTALCTSDPQSARVNNPLRSVSCYDSFVSECAEDREVRHVDCYMSL